MRVHALGCARWATRCGWGRGRIARALGIDSDTLATWQQRFADPADRLRAKPLGAPALVASPVQRRDVLDFLALHGTALGVDVLKDHFPLLAKRDLACLLTFARQEAHDAQAGHGHDRALLARNCRALRGRRDSLLRSRRDLGLLGGRVV